MSKSNLDATEVFWIWVIFCMSCFKYIFNDSRIAADRLGPWKAHNTYFYFLMSFLFLAFTTNFKSLLGLWLMGPWKGHCSFIGPYSGLCLTPPSLAHVRAGAVWKRWYTLSPRTAGFWLQLESWRSLLIIDNKRVENPEILNMLAINRENLIKSIKQ